MGDENAKYKEEKKTQRDLRQRNGKKIKEKRVYMVRLKGYCTGYDDMEKICERLTTQCIIPIPNDQKG